MMCLCFWGEFIQAITMVPVFIIHSMHRQQFTSQSLTGMIHSVFSYLMHFNVWWQQQGEWPDWTIELYILDKCFILFMVWGIHYHTEPVSAKIVAVPCLIDASHIVLYQYYYIATKYAYFDIFLLSYMIYVYAVIFMYSTNIGKVAIHILLIFLMALGYSMDIPGLMHTMLVPNFWLLYDFIGTRKYVHSIK